MTRTREAAANLIQQVRGVALPIGLIDLLSGQVIAISDSAVGFGPRAAQEIVQHPVVDSIGSDSRAGIVAALEAMATGSVDLLRMQPLVLFDGSSRPVISWLRRIDLDGRPLALFELADHEGSGDSPLAAYLGGEPPEFAIGALDEAGRVERLSDSISGILGIDARELIGRELFGEVQRPDLDLALRALDGLGADDAVGLQITARDAAGNPRPVHLILTSVSGRRPLRGFIVIPHVQDGRESSSRVAELEQHLWNIAREVEAAGIVVRLGAPTGHQLPSEQAALTPRQWDVLERLLHGDRVPTIAKELFLSQSTVRGHVSAILRRFGASSQAELLRLFRAGSTPP